MARRTLTAGELVPFPEKPLEPGALVVRNIMDAAKGSNLLVPPAWRGILGKQAKALFEDGFEIDMITAACWMALQRGQPHLVQYIAGDLALAVSGHRMSRSEYETKVALFAADKSARPNLLEEQRQRRAVRSAEIDERRRGDVS